MEQKSQGRYFLHVSIKSKDAWDDEMRRSVESSTQAELVVSSKFRFMTNCPCNSKALIVRRTRTNQTKLDFHNWENPGIPEKRKDSEVRRWTLTMGGKQRAH